MANETNQKYENIFNLIDKAGGPKLKKAKELSFDERGKAVFNIWAAIFQPFFYLYKGMWKKAITYTVISMAISILAVLIIENFLSNYSIYSNIVVMAIYMSVFGTRANIDLYKKIRLNENGWM